MALAIASVKGSELPVSATLPGTFSCTMQKCISLLHAYTTDLARAQDLYVAMLCRMYDILRSRLLPLKNDLQLPQTYLALPADV